MSSVKSIPPSLGGPGQTARGALQFRTFLPLVWLTLLVISPVFSDSFQEQVREHLSLSTLLKSRQANLDQLRAVTVAARIEGREYDALLDEFGALTGLRASDPFRAPSRGEPASIQVAALVRAVQEASLKDVEPDAPAPIVLLSVTPGARQRLGPFSMTEYELNLEGRFHALPAFLDLLTQVGRHQRLAISIGSLRLLSRPDTSRTGMLSITLPVRAYVRD